MELALYLATVFLSLIFSVKRKLVISNYSFFLFFLFWAVLSSVVIRSSGFDTDIINYSRAMSESSFSFYSLREPVVWIGQRLAYNLLESEILVFILFDIIAFLIIYRAFRNFNLPQYAFFSILCFFPFILGVQNVYRQWFSVALILLSFSYLNRSFIKRYFYFLAAGLSHNVAGLFLASFLTASNKRAEKIFGFIYLLIMPLIISLASDTKSSANTGQNLVVAYLALLFLVSIFVIASSRFKIKLFEKSRYTILATSLYSVLLSALILTSTGAERTAMYCLILYYPYLVLVIEDKFKQSVVLRVLLILGGFIPILLFGTREFLLTQGA